MWMNEIESHIIVVSLIWILINPMPSKNNDNDESSRKHKSSKNNNMAPMEIWEKLINNILSLLFYCFSTLSKLNYNLIVNRLLYKKGWENVN